MTTTEPRLVGLLHGATDGQAMPVTNELIPHAHALLSTTPLRWLCLTAALPWGCLLARQPAAGEWSALERLRHLLITERSLP